MLYDSAQLARVYLHAWQVTGEPFYRTIVEETLDYVVREMTLPEGGFYSTQDADSEGEEAKFFVWTPDEVRAVLGDQAKPFLVAYDVTEQGNFEGHNILEFTGSLGERASLAGAHRRLLEAREKRVHPGRDDKVLTSWDGLMLAAFAEAARVLGREDGLAERAHIYRQVAKGSAEFLLGELRTPEGRLYYTWKDGVARVNGYLEDYTHLIEGLLELYQTTFDPRWYRAVHELAEAMIEHFRASEGFYDTSDDHESLIVRPRELQDNAVPSGNGMAATALLKLAGLANKPRYAELAHQVLAQMQSMVAQYPLGFGQWLQALSYGLSQPREIAIVGEPDAGDTRALLAVAQDGYRPFQVMGLGAPSTQPSPVPLLQSRGLVDGWPAAYVCHNLTCQAPVTEPEPLRALLEQR